MTFFEHIPIYVFLIFFGLVILGLRQLKDRTVTLEKVLIFPIVMNLFSLYATWGFHADYLVLLGWVLGYLIVVLPKRNTIQSFIRMDWGRSLIKKGSFIPLILMLLIFALRFIMGYVKVRHPDLVSMTVFYLPVALLGGILSASLLVLTFSQLKKGN